MKTFLPKVDEIERKWWIIDADHQVLGRLARDIAMILRGKNKPTPPDATSTMRRTTRWPLP